MQAIPKNPENQENLVQTASLAIAEVLYDETKQSSLLSPEAQKMQIAKEVEKELVSAQQKIQEGLVSCVEALEDRQVAEEILQLLFVPYLLVTQEVAVAQAGSTMEENTSWKEQLKIPENLMDNLYSAAKRLFEQGDFERAESAFYFLANLDPNDYSIWVGLGASSAKLELIEQAINAFAVASTLEPENPWPHIWAGNLFLKQKDRDSAQVALASALPLAGQDLDLVELIEEKLKK